MSISRPSGVEARNSQVCPSFHGGLLYAAIQLERFSREDKNVAGIFTSRSLSVAALPSDGDGW